MQWFMVIYIFVAGEWLEDTRIPYPGSESCIQAQWRFTEANPEIQQIRASCELQD